MLDAPRILVACDDQEDRERIVETLKKSGYSSVFPVASGDEAIGLLSTMDMNMVVTDIPLGRMDAWRLTRLIRAGILKSDANTPVILISRTHSERIVMATAKEFELDAYLDFDCLQELPYVVENALRQDMNERPRHSLLIIEDYEDTQRLIERILGSRFDIDVADDGEQGLALWQEKQHDLVLLDMMLPKMSGDQVLNRILQEYPSQSVVIMTAYGTMETAGRLVMDGAVDFIPKPFRSDQLRRVCEIAVRREDYMVSQEQFLEKQEALFREQQRASIMLDSMGDAVISTDIEGNVTYLNILAESIIGWSSDDAYGKSLSELCTIYNGISRLVKENPVAACVGRNEVISCSNNIMRVRRYNTELNVEGSVAPLRNSRGVVEGTVMVIRDMTEQKRMAEQLSYQATHDTLTGLTNRFEFERRLDRAIEQSKSRGYEHSLCYMDLDQFKVVNDTCGHMAGDQLLRNIADIMSREIRRGVDTIARLGGDEFVLLLERCSLDQAQEVAELLCRAVQDCRFAWEEKTFSVGVSIGLVDINTETKDVQQALGNADTACYLAKEKGRNRVHVFRSNDSELIQRRGEMEILSKIHEAYEDDRFFLQYQIIEPLRTGLDEQASLRYELLIRMKDENGEWLSPGFFLPAAERYNLAPLIDRWVVKSALKWFSEHPEQLERLACCNINLSGLSFNDDEFYPFLKQAFIESSVEPEKICFEVTETAAVTNLNRATSFIAAVKDLGCQFALDDFGSGMSSFAYLKHLPVDYLKIDGMFVKDMLQDPIDHAMVRAINEVGQVLGLNTIAEFVENEQIQRALEDMGVDYGQGYGIAKPMMMSNLLEK